MSETLEIEDLTAEGVAILGVDAPKPRKRRASRILTHAWLTWVDLNTAGERLGRGAQAVMQMAKKIERTKKIGNDTLVDIDAVTEAYANSKRGRKASVVPDGYVALKSFASQGFSVNNLKIMGIELTDSYSVIDGVECVADDFDVIEFAFSEEAQARSREYATARSPHNRKANEDAAEAA